jgi:trk system potassium uptake protein TrkH
MLNPKKVEVIKVEGNVVSEDYIEGVQEFFIVHIFIWLVCAFLISFDNYGDIETNLTASLACISNIGPGLAKVGPYGGYAGYSNFSKLILSIEMIAGRLELFPILIMFAPKTWRKRIA